MPFLISALRASVCGLMLIAGRGAFAQPVEYASTEEAIAALYSTEQIAEWTRVVGDFDADGIDDVALILTVFDENAPMGTRLLVLAGRPGGRYSKMSASSKYCNAQKFFNLEAKGSSLYVAAVQKADSDAIASETLQFRFNRKLADLELIGAEHSWESFSDGSYGRLSFNYLTGSAVEYKRMHGKIKESKRSTFPISQLARLNGFDCDK